LLSLRLPALPVGRLRPDFVGTRNDSVMDSRFRGNDKKRSNKLVNAPPLGKWGKFEVLGEAIFRREIQAPLF
ncbi:MAG: hypothetical protein Q7O04_06360, partial [Candidatus Omnitrophota bacterium]|nr:hypothetical protein [Candidatus Omnitrophota bacterium]